MSTVIQAGKKEAAHGRRGPLHPPGLNVGEGGRVSRRIFNRPVSAPEGTTGSLGYPSGDWADGASRVERRREGGILGRGSFPPSAHHSMRTAAPLDGASALVGRPARSWAGLPAACPRRYLR